MKFIIIPTLLCWSLVLASPKKDHSQSESSKSDEKDSSLASASTMPTIDTIDYPCADCVAHGYGTLTSMNSDYEGASVDGNQTEEQENTKKRNLTEEGESSKSDKETKKLKTTETNTNDSSITPEPESNAISEEKAPTLEKTDQSEPETVQDAPLPITNDGMHFIHQIIS